VVVGRAQDLYRAELLVGSVNWLSIPAPSEARRCRVRIRHQHRPAPAILIPDEAGQVLVRFDQPQRAVAPGQAAVFYDHDVVLGGGIIGRATDQTPANASRWNQVMHPVPRPRTTRKVCHE